MSSKSTWDQYVIDHPDAGLKTGRPVSWRNYSHIFAEGHHECPLRPRVRGLLLDPPPPPFVFVVALSSQKHLIFRAKTALSRDLFPVQVEDDGVLVNRDLFARMLDDFEALVSAGASKDQVLSGRYHPATLKNIGPARFRNLEAKIKPWRKLQPHWMRLAHFCAQKKEVMTNAQS